MLGNNLDEVKNQNNNVKVTKTIKKVLNNDSENPEIVEETVYYDKDEVEKFNNFENGDFDIDENASNVRKDVTVEEDENGTITKVVNIEYSILEDDINNEGDIIVETSIINDGTERTEQGEKSFITNMDSVIMDEAGGISFIEKEKLDKIEERTTNNETDNLNVNSTEEKADRSFIEQVKSVFTGRGKKEEKPKVNIKRVYSKDLYSYDDHPSQSEEIIEVVQPQVEEKIETPIDDDDFVSAPEEESTFFSNFKVNVPKKETTTIDEEVNENDEANKSFFSRFKINIPGRKKDDTSIVEEVVETVEGAEPKIETIEKSEDAAVDGETSTTTEVVVDPETGKKKTVTKKVTRKVITKSIGEDLSVNQDGETSTTEIVVDPVTGKKKYVTKRVIRKLITKSGTKEDVVDEPTITTRELPGGITETTELVVDPITGKKKYVTKRIIRKIINVVDNEEPSEVVEQEIVSEIPASEVKEQIVEVPSGIPGKKKYIKRIIRYIKRVNPTTGEEEVVEEPFEEVVTEPREGVVPEAKEEIIEVPSEVPGKKKYIKRIIRYIKRINPTTGEEEIVEEQPVEEVVSEEEQKKPGFIDRLANKVEKIVTVEKKQSEEPVTEVKEEIVEVPSEEPGKKKYIKRIIRYIKRINPVTCKEEVV